MNATAIVPFDSTQPGPFTLPHNLGIIPTTVIFELDSPGTVWFQPQRYDETNLYLIASDFDITGVAIVFAECGC